jgi:hypothetical protein
MSGRHSIVFSSTRLLEQREEILEPEYRDRPGIASLPGKANGDPTRVSGGVCFRLFEKPESADPRAVLRFYDEVVS